MVFEYVFANLLNSYLSSFIDDVSANQLKLGLLKGKFELQNLTVKENALDGLNLPFTLLHGRIGALSANIPWSTLYTSQKEPWSVTIEELFLVFGPRTSFEYNAEQDQLSTQSVKFGLLESLENKWKLHHQTQQDYYASSYSAWISYVTSLITTIIENLQLNVKSVHIRYEDRLSNASVAGGIVIKSLSAYSTDEHWQAKFINSADASNISRKALHLEDFGVYWDSNALLTSDLAAEQEEWVEFMQNVMNFNVISDGNQCEHDFLIAPVRGRAHVARNFSEQPLKSRNKPRIMLDLEFEDFSLSLNIKQYLQLLEWADEIVRIDTLWKHRKWRPSAPVRGNARQWWRYAINANMEQWREQRNRENWNFVLERSQMICRYCKVYYEFLMAPESMNPETIEFKERIECELDFDELFTLREIVCDMRRKDNYSRKYFDQPNGERITNTTSWGYLNGWIPSWISYNSETEMYESSLDLNQTVGGDDVSITSNVDEELIDAVSSAINDTLMSQDNIFLRMNITIKRATAVILTDLNGLCKSKSSLRQSIPFVMEPLLEFVMTRLEATFETSPRLNVCDITIANLLMRDKSHNTSCVKGMLPSPTGDEPECSMSKRPEDIITIKYSFNNQDKETVDLVFNSFEVVFNQETLVELIRFFKHAPRRQRLRKIDKRTQLRWKEAEITRRRFSTLPKDLHTVTVNCTFRQLNIVLLRVSDIPTPTEDLKLATTTINRANISINYNRKEIRVDGFLNNLQIIDNCHPAASSEERRVVNVGDEHVLDEELPEKQRAISFLLRRVFADDLLEIQTKMSSLFYKHSAKLLQELASCASEFKFYMTSLANTIREAATEVAKEIVSRTATELSVDGIPRHTLERSLFDDPQPKHPHHLHPSLHRKKTPTDNSLRSKIRSYIKDFRLEVHVYSPLIILPSSPGALDSFKKIIATTRNNEKLKNSFQINASDRLKFISLGLEVRNGTLRFVDDVDRIDSPLIEVNAKELSLWQRIRNEHTKGNAKAHFSSDYYNLAKKGWEPLIEPWKFDVMYESRKKGWDKEGILQRHMSDSQTRKIVFNFSSNGVLNVNLTSTALEMYRKLKLLWSEQVQVKQPSRHHSFVPYTFSSEVNSNLAMSAIRGTPQFERMQRFSSWLPSLLNLKSEPTPSYEIQIIVEMDGLAFSIVNAKNEELIYVTFKTIILDYMYTPCKQSLNFSICNFQIDNQLYEAKKAVVIYPMPLDMNDPMQGQPAIRVSIQKHEVLNPNVLLFPELQVTIKDIVFNLEELLLLKLYDFFGYPWDEPMDGQFEGDLGNRQSFTTSELANVRVFLSMMNLTLNQVRLSVITTSHLPLDLLHLKRRVGLTLLAFEDANVQLHSFKREYWFDTYQFLQDAVFNHYKTQLRNQAAKILISVDFLGNPLGLVNDVTDGINEFMNDGNLGGLVTNITHGISNSTAKFMSSLSDSLDLATMDIRHQEIRRRIKQQDSRDRLRIGLRGLGFGILGGMTSIVTQTYEGISNEGLPGLMSGFGRGVLGTFTKPAVGMLDFATEAASVVRDTSRKISNQYMPPPRRIRLPRLRFAYNGLLLPYDQEQAEGQLYFSQADLEQQTDELFHHIEIILPDMACIITSERVLFVTWGSHLTDSRKPIMSIPFDSLLRCSVQMLELTNSMLGAHLIFTVFTRSHVAVHALMPGLTEERTRTPHVRCSSEEVANNVCKRINCCKAFYDERKYRKLVG